MEKEIVSKRILPYVMTMEQPNAGDQRVQTILPIILTEMNFLPPGGIHGPHLMVVVLWDGLSGRTEHRLDQTLL